MVIITRSAYRKACESSNSSDVSQNNIIPPWCSSGKVQGKRKPRRAPSTWEIRSSYPLRENIWEYLYKEQSVDCGKRRTQCSRREKPKRANGKTATVFFIVLLATLGVMTSIWMNNIPKLSLLSSVIPKEKLVSLLGIPKSTSVSEECCHKMRYLAAELSRVEQALRHTQRVRKTTLVASNELRNGANPDTDRSYIEGARITRGSDTKEWGGQVALWGVVPLWRAAPPPDTVLTLRKPTPSDCWPFSGTYGEIIIELPQKSDVRSISLEHVQPDTAKSAPKTFILYGILENGTWVPAIEGEYQCRGPAKQYFYSNWSYPLKHMVFRVLSNQGNPKYTCLYRVHIYGK